MGSCSSVHRNQETNMKLLGLSFCSKSDKLVIPPTPIKEKPKNGNFLVDGVALKSHWSPSRSATPFNGSKEEVFFESKAWIDSDCDDDFYSVNGEFTPSRGSTPVHHTFGTPSVNKTPSEPSPTEKKKKLLDLFRESVREDPNDDVAGKTNSSRNEMKEAKPIINDVLPKSAHSTPYISGGNSACNSERTLNGDDHSSIREKSVKSGQWCLPSLASCRSFSERRRKTSPAIAAANGNA